MKCLIQTTKKGRSHGSAAGNAIIREASSHSTEGGAAGVVNFFKRWLRNAAAVANLENPRCKVTVLEYLWLHVSRRQGAIFPLGL